MHVSSARRKGRAEKGEERKIYDGKPTEMSCAIPCSHSLSLAVLRDKQQGTRCRVPGQGGPCPSEAEPELCPATAICSFNLHSPQLTAVSYLQQGTLHKADDSTALLQSSSADSACDRQELRKGVMRAPHLPGARGRGEARKGDSFIPTREAAAPSSFRSAPAAIPALV